MRVADPTRAACSLHEGMVADQRVEKRGGLVLKRRICVVTEAGDSWRPAAAAEERPASLTTDTVRTLVAGTGIDVEPLGERTLKGVPGKWLICRLTFTGTNT